MKSILKISLLSLVMVFAFSCKKDAASAVKGDAAKVENQAGANYKVDKVASKVRWSGSKIGGSHNGTLSISDGEIVVSAGKVSGGKFTIDMASLLCEDLEGDAKGKLEGHLKSPDFFDVAAFPSAKFEITKVTELVDDMKGNALVYGNLTIKDVTRLLGFKSNITVSGKDVIVNVPNFNFNRTDFGIKYGSSSLTDVVKDKAISDQVGISIALATE